MLGHATIFILASLFRIDVGQLCFSEKSVQRYPADRQPVVRNLSIRLAKYYSNPNGLCQSLRKLKRAKPSRVVHSRRSGVIPVRRITGVLLLLLLTSPLVTPLFARNPQTDLPVCCRRNGKHHCAEHMQMPAPEGTQFMSSGMKCPMFPVRLATPGHSPQILPINSQAFYGAIVSHPSIHTQAEISYRICWSRSQQKRGPPVVA